MRRIASGSSSFAIAYWYAPFCCVPSTHNVRILKEIIPVIEPRQFQVNEAWIAFKLNDAPISTKEDGDFNVLALMDVASCYILGTEFVSTRSAQPSELESRHLIKSGYSQNQQFPSKLFIPASLVADSLCVEAERHSIAVVHIPEEQLLVCISEAREGFKEHVSGSVIQ